MKTKEFKPILQDNVNIERIIIELKVTKAEYVDNKIKKQGEVAILKSILNKHRFEKKNCESVKATRAKLRQELDEIEFNIKKINLQIAAKRKLLNPENNLLKQIKILKDNYSMFSKDKRCIPNLRAMAAEVSRELEHIIDNNF